MIRVLIAEDQGMVRGALAALIALEPDLDVVAQVARGDAVMPAALQAQPDVALVDIEMPGMDGLAAAEQLRRVLPTCKVLMLTTFGRPGYVHRAMRAGAAGFLAKDGPSEELASAVRRVYAGELVVDPVLAASALRHGENPLSAREREVLEAAVNGSTVVDIARRLALSEGTVRNYLSSAIRKMNAPNRVTAAETARRHGWL